jgi:hypothetical protein
MLAHSSASIKLSHYADNIILGGPVYPEYMIAMCKSAFLTYQSPINTFLDKISSDPKYAQAPAGSDANTISLVNDVKQRIQSIRLHILSMGEFFQVTEVTSHNISQRIYNMELLGAIEDLKESYIERTRYLKLANESSAKLQTLFSALAELVVSYSSRLLLRLCLRLIPRLPSILLGVDTSRVPKRYLAERR